jgi:hypothetical protein
MGGLHEWEQKEKINLLGVCLVSRSKHGPNILCLNAEDAKYESSRRISSKRIHKDGSITVFKVKVLKMADFADYSGFMDKTGE